MTKEKMIEDLEKFLDNSSLCYSNSSVFNDSVISAMNLLADIKGYKVQFCRKSVRPNPYVKSKDK